MMTEILLWSHCQARLNNDIILLSENWGNIFQLKRRPKIGRETLFLFKVKKKGVFISRMVKFPPISLSLTIEAFSIFYFNNCFHLFMSACILTIALYSVKVGCWPVLGNRNVTKIFPGPQNEISINFKMLLHLNQTNSSLETYSSFKSVTVRS